MKASEKTNLLGLTKEQLAVFVEEIGEPGYRARQIFEWLYQHGATEFSAMTNLGKAFRSRLALSADIRGVATEAQTRSSDGTTKFLFSLSDGLKIESVLISPQNSAGDAEADEDESDPPDGEPRQRLTLCVSTQVGCPLDCAFCATGTMGFLRNLTSAEIVAQVLEVRRLTGAAITNIVFMGMGEPLLNYDSVMTASSILSTGAGIAARRITVSTAGRTDRIRQLGDEWRRVKLAVSLHSAVNETRSRLMPINRRFPLEQLADALAYYYEKTRQRVTYEFIFFDGVNDTEAEVRALIRFARRIPCKINVIPFHSIAFTLPTGFSASLHPSPRVEEVVRHLRTHHLTAIVRSSAGKDIDAACGQLAVRVTRRANTHTPATT